MAKRMVGRLMGNDTDLAKELSRLEKDLIQMKTSQPVGSNSVRAYETLTNFVWDYDYTMSSSNYNGLSYTHGFGVKFVARSQSAPFASIRLIAQVNGDRYNPLSAQNNNGGVTTGVDNSYITIYEDITTTGNLSDYALDNTVRWVVGTNCKSAGTNFKIKVIVTATDLGRIEIRPNNTF